ncbi:zinc finger [Striga asiatica]|uniref:Zinc finger n=1 Tax=Striga asiatica TaxID=4170 RepID=A0A5A7PUY6_STRAF|nr:zinc finger [Striga asiatica]GER36498.1 zinc finger [Striga asiatica]GER42718.1 zinc finger [Striga asiatica]
MQTNDCKFFEWHDAELPPFQKACFLRMKAQKNLLEEQLKCKSISESLMSERLEIKENELHQLKNKIQELEMKENELHQLKKKIEELEQNVHNHSRRLKFERNVFMLFLFVLFVSMFIVRDSGKGQLMLK